MRTYLLLHMFAGCLWLLLDLWLFLVLAGIGRPSPLLSLVLYWAGMLFGPICLIVGSIRLLRSARSRAGLLLVIIGCLYFTGFALYETAIGMQHTPLQPPPLYPLYVTLLVVMVLLDLAACKLWRAVTLSPAGRE